MAVPSGRAGQPNAFWDHPGETKEEKFAKTSRDVLEKLDAIVKQGSRREAKESSDSAIPDDYTYNEQLTVEAGRSFRKYLNRYNI